MWVQKIQESCAREGVPCVLDKKSHHFQSFRDDEKDCIKLFLNPHALKRHDDEHPERIEGIASCFVKQHDMINYFVIVKDRDLDMVKEFHKWRTTDFETLQNKKTLTPKTECIICYKRPIGKNKHKMGFISCKQCSAFTCLSCLDKVRVHGYEKCPQCRYLFLEGPIWGAAYEEKNKKRVTRALERHSISPEIVEQHKPTKHALTILGTLLENLDGETKVLMKCDDNLFDGDLSISKYSYSNRYTRDTEYMIGDVKEGVAIVLREALRRDIRRIDILLVHTTYKIDKEKEVPIKEVAAFRFSTRFGLIPLSKNAWYIDDYFDTSSEAAFSYQKIEMLDPFDAESHVPCCIKNIIASLKNQPHRKCVTFIVPEDGRQVKDLDGGKYVKYWLSFVIDVDGKVEMMTDEYVYNRIHHILFDYKSSKPVVFMHVYPLEEGLDHASFTVFETDDGFCLDEHDTQSRETLTDAVVAMASSSL